MPSNLTCSIPSFYSNGNIKNIITYNNGKVNSLVNYDTNNTIISMYEYDRNYDITDDNIKNINNTNNNINLELPTFYEGGNLKSLVSIEQDKTVYSYYDNITQLSYKFEYDIQYNIINSKIYDNNKNIIYEMYKDDNNNIYENVRILIPFIIICKLVNGKMYDEYIVSNLYKQYTVIPGMMLLNNTEIFIFDDNDTIYNNIHKIINSKELYYYLNEYIQLNVVENNSINGKYVEYIDDEEKIICHYENNKLHGKYTKYYDNFKVYKCCNYLYGELYGKYEEFYDNGNPSIICNYNNGKLHGNYKEFYNNKKLYINCNYYNGKLHNNFEEFYIIKSLDNIKKIYKKVFNNSFYVKDNLSMYLNNHSDNKLLSIYTARQYFENNYKKSNTYICDLNDENHMKNKILITEFIKKSSDTNNHELHLYNVYNKNIKDEKLIYEFINKYINFSDSAFVVNVFYYIHLENFKIILYLQDNLLNIKVLTDDILLNHKQYNIVYNKYKFLKQIYPVSNFFGIF